MANTRLGVKNVGSPWEIFSMAPGIDPHIRRRRRSCAPSSFFTAGPVACADALFSSLRSAFGFIFVTASEHIIFLRLAKRAPPLLHRAPRRGSRYRPGGS